MITFQATYFDGKSSKASPVTVTFTGASLYIQCDHERSSFSVPIQECTITPPLGRTSRSITLSGGAQIETSNVKAIADLERYTGSNMGMRLVHFFEQHWKAAAGSLLGLALFAWMLLTYGIPFLAKKIAYSLSPEITETVSRQTVTILDAKFMKPSELDRNKAEEIRGRFRQLCKSTNTGINYRLEFRKSPLLGPNALALPSGIIVMTDELVKLSHDNRELEGVLLHEMAHVEHRHALRNILQNAGAYVLISVLVGDITSITTMAASLPTLLAQSGYSRDFEREADKSAALYFLQRGWSTKALQDILLRISRDAVNYPGESLLSSHPLTNERVTYLRELEKSSSKKHTPK